MELKITYDPTTSGSLGNAQRVKEEVDDFISNGTITTSISHSLMEGSTGDFKVMLGDDCCVYDKSHPTRNNRFPDDNEIATTVKTRCDFNSFTLCRDGEK